jgi:DNA-binding transcriptional MerR regulator
MEYTVGQLAKLAGVSTRTLRYYDHIGLLKPETIRSSGYRTYAQAQVDRLQQILFYRELDVELEMINRLLDAPDFEQARALQDHLQALTVRRDRLDALIETVKNTMAAEKGERTMTDEQKFRAFKQNLIDENERKYGAEARSLYGNEAVDASNAKLKAMTKEQLDRTEALSREVNEAIKAAFETGDPAGELAHKACELHKQWLMCYWKSYSPEAHKGVAQMYVDDPRFTAYYDAIAPGSAVFLRDAIFAYYR